MAKRRPREYEEHEAYFTPLPVIHQGLASIGTLMAAPPRVVLDLCAGAGAFGQVARHLWPAATLIAVEIRRSEAPHLRRHYDDVIIADATRCALPRADLICSNPAFSLTLPLAQRALAQLEPQGFAPFLTRQTFGDAEEAEAFLSESMPLIELTISGRVSMGAAAEATKDNFGYQWLVWDALGRGPWLRRLLPRLAGHDLGWTARPGTGRLLPVDDDLIVDLRGVLGRQQLTETRLRAALPNIVELARPTRRPSHG